MACIYSRNSLYWENEDSKNWLISQKYCHVMPRHVFLSIVSLNLITVILVRVLSVLQTYCPRGFRLDFGSMFGFRCCALAFVCICYITQDILKGGFTCLLLMLENVNQHKA